MTDVVNESKALFYSPPDAMDPFVDPMIRPICVAINRSGWVWTAESCQGHPDADQGGAWAANVSPMLRLVTKDETIGRMFECLTAAFLQAKSRLPRGELFEVRGMRVYPSSRPSPGWRETLIYLEAVNVYQRNQALDVWKGFSELVSRPN